MWMSGGGRWWLVLEDDSKTGAILACVHDFAKDKPLSITRKGKKNSCPDNVYNVYIYPKR